MNQNVEIEVKAKTVDLAVEVAMQELGVQDRDQVAVDILTEPVKGFLGMGGQDAVVRVKRKPAKRRRNRKQQGKDRNQRSGNKSKHPEKRQNKQSRQNKGKQSQPKRSKPVDKPAKVGKHQKTENNVSDDRPNLTIEKQAEVTREFLEGLVEAYGLEGDVTTSVDGDFIVADVSGDQTEALVGIRGSVRSAIHELTRTVLQRYSSDTARLRLDIAGYGERRRKALSIYADQLIEQVVSEGGEIMLEPMSPADRKVIHDAAAASDLVTSYSEGEPPRRYVVLSKVEGSEEE